MESFAGILLVVMPSNGAMANEAITKKSGYRYACAMTSGYQTKAIFVRFLNVLAQRSADRTPKIGKGPGAGTGPFVGTGSGSSVVVPGGTLAPPNGSPTKVGRPFGKVEDAVRSASRADWTAKPSLKTNENKLPISSDGVAPKLSILLNKSMSTPKRNLSPDLKALSANVSVIDDCPLRAALPPTRVISEAKRPFRSPAEIAKGEELLPGEISVESKNALTGVRSTLRLFRKTLLAPPLLNFTRKKSFESNGVEPRVSIKTLGTGARKGLVSNLVF